MLGLKLVHVSKRGRWFELILFPLCAYFCQFRNIKKVFIWNVTGTVCQLWSNWVSHPGGHYWDYYLDIVSLNKVTAAHLMFGVPPQFSFACYRSSVELQRLDQMAQCQVSRLSNHCLACIYLPMPLMPVSGTKDLTQTIINTHGAMLH